jgi:hypothetical protein
VSLPTVPALTVVALACEQAANEPVIASKSPAAIAFLNMFFILCVLLSLSFFFRFKIDFVLA